MADLQVDEVEGRSFPDLFDDAAVIDDYIGMPCGPPPMSF